MQTYNWQKKDWPRFHYSLEGLESKVLIFAEKVGHISGILKALPKDTQVEAMIDMMVSEAIKTSEIEGEFFSRKDVLSSIKKNLGLKTDISQSTDKNVDGIGRLMIDVRNNFKKPLTKEILFDWHKMLLPEAKNIIVGNWREHEEPMQVISGASGKWKIHYEAPPSNMVPVEMDRFIEWFNDTAPGGSKEIINAPLRTSIAHLYFETLHPFEDGNGRIGRAIAEKALSQGIGRPVMLSLSRTIEANKKHYYDALEKAQRSNEITPWINYFIQVIVSAQITAEEQIEFTLKKVQFFDTFKGKLNERQTLAIKRMLEEGPPGFKGGMNARKYIGITKTSKATATRDLQELTAMGAVTSFGNSRSISYQLKLT